MVVLYAHGNRLGTWAEVEETFEALAKSVTIEFRDEHGNVIVKTVPPKGPLCPWDPSYTMEDAERDSAEGGITLAEFWKKMGVQ